MTADFYQTVERKCEECFELGSSVATRFGGSLDLLGGRRSDFEFIVFICSNHANQGLNSSGDGNKAYREEEGAFWEP